MSSFLFKVSQKNQFLLKHSLMFTCDFLFGMSMLLGGSRLSIVSVSLFGSSMFFGSGMLLGGNTLLGSDMLLGGGMLLNSGFGLLRGSSLGFLGSGITTIRRRASSDTLIRIDFSRGINTSTERIIYCRPASRRCIISLIEEIFKGRNTQIQAIATKINSQDIDELGRVV